MIEGLDSMNPPTAAQARAAGAAGKRIWSGYLATKPDVGLARAWTRQDFDNARLTGDMPLAYVSGWDDPVALKALAAEWNVRACLDDEGGIRPGGAWEQPFLDALRDDARGSGGLYGNSPVHRLRALFNILSAYPTGGDPAGASWWVQTPHPNTPCGWQWAGTHSFAGVGVDSTWFDDWFGGLHGAAADLLSSHRQLHTTEDSNVAILFHPTITDRMDVLSIGSDGAVYHFWGTTDALTKGTAGSEAWGGKFLPGTLSATWYNDPANVRLVAQAVDAAGIAHIREVDTSGKVVREWAPLMADATHQLAVGLPSLPAGPDLSAAVGAAQAAAAAATATASKVEAAVNAAAAELARA